MHKTARGSYLPPHGLAMLALVLLADHGAWPMTVQIVATEVDGDHSWVVAHCECSLDDDGDALLKNVVEMVREAYGELKLRDIIERLEDADPSVTAKFDTHAILAAVRRGMPNPATEMATQKPAHLTNYRSEPCEVIAKHTLKLAFNIEFPVAPQRGKTNPNMPILGFDHWGALRTASGNHMLVLVQVKGTEEDESPPQVCNKLVEECKEVPNQADVICRALTILAIALEGTRCKSQS